jgi:hypothetical protein
MSLKPGQSVNVLCGGGRVWRKGAVVRRIDVNPGEEWYEIIYYKRRAGKVQYGNFSILWLEKEPPRRKRSLRPRMRANSINAPGK